LEFATAGDPMSSRKWTRKSSRTVAEALGVSHTKARRMLRRSDYHLRFNRKRLTRRGSPDREEQFRIIEGLRNKFCAAGNPIISVDAKKRELVGPFKNAGRAWTREPVDVSMYDYPSDAEGVAIPYGVLDVTRGNGFVTVGTSHNTAAFAAFSIATWWALAGRRVYEGAKKLLILADGGSSNSTKAMMWKLGVQALATLLRLDITVAHYPVGASKWNPVEHRLFGPISTNWAAVPLRCYRTILGLIRSTSTTTCGPHRENFPRAFSMTVVWQHKVFGSIVGSAFRASTTPCSLSPICRRQRRSFYRRSSDQVV